MEAAAIQHDRGYVDPEYLRITAQLLTRAKLASHAQMRIARGHRVLDLGCGPATDTIALGQLTTPTGEVIGVDRDPAMIEEAERRAARAGVAGWVLHRVADAESLPFESARFDACRSERLFQHLPDCDRALAELVRVTRSGGRIAILDTDWGTWSTDTAETDIERRLARFLVEHCLHNGHAGRRLPGLFRRHGLVDVSIELFPLALTDYALGRVDACLDIVESKALRSNVLTPGELARWRSSLEDADRRGAYFSSVTTVLASASKPLH